MDYKEYLEHSKTVKISKNFTQYDVCHSETALKLKINNIPSPQNIQNSIILVKNVLEVIRGYYNKPLLVSCMFRCAELNKAVGGASTSQHLTGRASTSQHLTGQACDFIISGIECKKIFNDLISGRIIHPSKKKLKDLIDQCIFEKTKTSEWIHISYTTKVNRKQFLTMQNGKYTIVTKELI